MSFMSNVEVDKPYTWKKYKDGMCNHCLANCCKMPLEVSKADLLQMGLITEFDMDEPVRTLEKRLKKEKIIQHYRHKTELFLIRQEVNGDCFLLDPETKKCSIYNNMPQACINFPTVSSRSGFCPYLRN